MNPVYVPLLSALAGAIIGSLSSIATIVIQAKIGERRERVRQAAMLALEELKIQMSHAAPGTAIFPISIYLVWSKYWSDASISPIENLIALITVPVPHRRSG